MRVALLIALSVILVAGVAEGREITVQKGDTLTSIAKRYRVKPSELRRWNGLRKDTIRPGDTLSIGPTTRSYRIRKGETLRGIAKREGVSEADLLKWNPDIEPRRIRAGQILVLTPQGPRSKGNQPPERTESKEERIAERREKKVERLECPGRVVQLASHPSYQVRSKALGWATAQTSLALKRGFDQVRRIHKYAPRVKVLDASMREGGQLGGHLSHQTGHDVDITYYQRRCPSSGCPLTNVAPNDLDARRQWTLFSYWLRHHDVQFILVDYKLQKALYERAKKAGVSEKKLREWFQYPRPIGMQAGKIYHWNGHGNHLHVRFNPARCPAGCCRPLTSVARSKPTVPAPAETAAAPPADDATVNAEAPPVSQPDVHADTTTEQ